eukprot:6176326-Pleurochrysis_carterae.AAC.1
MTRRVKWKVSNVDNHGGRNVKDAGKGKVVNEAACSTQLQVHGIGCTRRLLWLCKSPALAHLEILSCTRPYEGFS